MRNILSILLLTLWATHLHAQLPKEVWFDPASTALAPMATGSMSNPLGGSGTAFDSNMTYITAGTTPGAPNYPDLVIHLKPGTYYTQGFVETLNFLTGGYWVLRKGQRLIGEGIDRSIIRRSSPNNDLRYVITTAPGEANIEVQDLTIDGNYWASSDTTISVGGLNMEHLGRVRGVKVTGTAGNTETAGKEMFTVRMSGQTYTRAWDRTARGGLVENCEISNIRGGSIAGIMIGSGQSTVVNNRIYMPHYSTAAQGDNTNRSTGINIADSEHTIIMGNFVSGSYSGFYNDTGSVTNISINGNQFYDCINGIEFVRSENIYVHADDLHINDNIIHLSNDINVADNRHGIILHSQTDDGGTYIARANVVDNLIKGGTSGASTWGIYMSRVNYPICHNNRLDNVGYVSFPSAYQQTYFDTSGGLIYNLFNHQGFPVSPEKWLAPRSSNWMNRKTVLSSDPASSYAILIGDNYIGLQKGGFTLSLPNASSYSGKEIVIVNETGTTLTGSVLNCTVAGQTINGATSVSLASPYTSVRVTSNGSNWIRF